MQTHNQGVLLCCGEIADTHSRLVWPCLIRAWSHAGEFNLQFAASTQACAAIVVAFKAVSVNQQALMYLIEEWTQLGIPQVCLQLRLSDWRLLHHICTTTGLAIWLTTCPAAMVRDALPVDECICCMSFRVSC